MQLTLTEILNYHAGRDFGSSGFREVALSVFNGTDKAFTYHVFHLWRVKDDSCSSLYFLSEPQILTGTAVLVVERPFAAEMQIWIRLRTAEHAIAVDSSRREQLVLGTDFTYSDLRFWLPTNEYQVDAISFNDSEDAPEWILNAQRCSLSKDASRVRIKLDGMRWLPLAIEWYRTEAINPVRIYSATDLVCCDGIWTPRVISVSRPHESYRTVMTLIRALHGAEVPSEMLQVRNLGHLVKSSFEEWNSSAEVFS